MKLERKLDEILRENELYTDFINVYEKDTKYPFKAVEIQINGDWKHEHLRLDYIMKKLGYIFLNKEVIGDSDGDWYVGKHLYTKLEQGW